MKRLSILLTVALLLAQLQTVVLAQSSTDQKNTTGLLQASSSEKEAENIVWQKVQYALDSQKDTYSLHSPAQVIPSAHAGANYDNALSYITIDYQSGNILEQKYPDAPVYIASLTKIMTAIVALDLMQPQETITVSQQAPEVIPTKIGLTTGEKMSLSDLMTAMLMYSANDAAQAIADGANAKYGENIFVRAMNAKAESLGLSHTHFANPQGFDDIKNYSSAADLVKLSHYALTHYPLFAQIVSTDYTTEPASPTHKAYSIPNWNGLLGVYPGVSGVKIGNTDDAGYTMVIVSERSGRKILAAILGTPGILERDTWMASLLDDTFSHFYNLPPVGITSTQLRAKYASWYSH